MEYAPEKQTSEYKHSAIPVREILFILMIMLNENIFYLVNRSGLRFIYDIKQLLGGILVGLCAVYLVRIVKSDFVFKRIVLLIWCWQVIGMFTAYFVFGQSIREGSYNILFPSLILSYFLVCFLIEDTQRFERIKDILVALSIISGLIYITQFILYPDVIFLDTDFRQRYGNVRFTEFFIFTNLCLFITLNMLLVKNRSGLKRKLFYLSAFIIQITILIFIAQSRLQILTSVILSGFAVVIMQKKRIIRWYLIMTLMAITCFGMMMFLILKLNGIDIESNPITESAAEVLNGTGNIGYRFREAIYFLGNMKGRWLFGWGTLNMNNPQAVLISGIKYKYYLVDVGIIGYVYTYGIIGTALTVFAIIKSVGLSIRIYRNDNTIIYPLLFNLSVFFNSFMIFYYQEVMALLYLGIIYAFMEFEYKKRGWHTWTTTQN